MTRSVYSQIDRRAYWAYVRVCLAAQCSPMSALHWMLQTQSSVDFAVKRWMGKERVVLKAQVCFEDSVHDRPWAKKSRTHRSDSVMLAHIGELNKQGARPGWVIGELRADGLVYPERKVVRSQTSPKGGYARDFAGHVKHFYAALNSAATVSLQAVPSARPATTPKELNVGNRARPLAGRQRDSPCATVRIQGENTLLLPQRGSLAFFIFRAKPLAVNSGTPQADAPEKENV